MKNLSRLITYLGFPAALFLLFSKPVFADSAMAFMVYSGSPVGTLTLGTFGIVFIIVSAIETMVIRKMADVTWQKAVIAAIAMNIVSTVLGALFAALLNHSCNSMIVLPFMIAFFWILLWRLKYSAGFILLTILCLLTMIPVAFLVWGSGGLSTAGLWACIIVQLIFGFGMTLPLEALAVTKYLPKAKVEKTILRANIYSYLFLLVIAPFFWPNPVEISLLSATDWPSFTFRTDGGKETAMLLYRKHLTTPELLGLKKIDANKGPFDATEIIEFGENRLRYNALERNMPGNRDDFYGMDIYNNIVEYAEFAQTIPNLQDTDRRDLEWLGLSAAMWKQVSSKMVEGNAEGAKNLYLEWRRREQDIESLRYGGHENKFDPLLWMHTLASKLDVTQDVKDMVDELIAEYGLASEALTP